MSRAACSAMVASLACTCPPVSRQSRKLSTVPKASRPARAAARAQTLDDFRRYVREMRARKQARRGAEIAVLVRRGYEVWILSGDTDARVAQFADQVGVHFLGLGEHHRTDFAISSPETVLAAIAARTKRIHLGSAVTVLSSDDPIRVFQRFATLDAVKAQPEIARFQFRVRNEARIVDPTIRVFETDPRARLKHRARFIAGEIERFRCRQ